MQYKRAMAKARLMDDEESKTRLELDEGTVFGKRYRTVRPFVINWYHVSEWSSMEDWCKEQFGPTPADGVWTPGARWYMNNSKFWFRNDADLSWFLLRWS